jgi:hypothetical protein
MKLTLHVLPMSARSSLKLSYYTHSRWVDPAALDGEGIGVSTLGQKALALAADGAGQVSLF